MGVNGDDPDGSPFDLSFPERIALAQIREIREAAGYDDSPYDDPAVAVRYIGALETALLGIYTDVSAEREERRQEIERASGPLYWLGYLVVSIAIALTISGMIWIGVLLWRAIL